VDILALGEAVIQILRFPLLLLFQYAPYLYILTKILSEGQTGQTWESSKKAGLSHSRGHWKQT